MKSISFTFVAILLLIGAFAKRIYADSDLFLNLQPGEKIFDKVDKVPVFKKNRGDVYRYLIKNIEYPVDALAKEIEGKVLVSCIITREGRLINPVVTKGLSKSIDKEAIRVVSYMQRWKPGEVNRAKVATKITLEVPFYLSEENKAIAKQLKPFYENNKVPLFILDKKKVNKIVTLEYYNIKSIRVVKGEKAIELYGPDAVNGVVIIETKNGTDPVYKR